MREGGWLNVQCSKHAVTSQIRTIWIVHACCKLIQLLCKSCTSTYVVSLLRRLEDLRQTKVYVSNFHYYTYLHGYGICVKWPYNCTLTIVGNTCMFLFHIHFHENCTYNLLDINIAKLTCLFKIKLKILIKPSMKIKMFQKSIMLLILKLI